MSAVVTCAGPVQQLAVDACLAAAAEWVRHTYHQNVVEPFLTKVIHVPTLQPSLLQAATSRETLPKNTEALLFSVFLMAAVSLSEDECVTLLGYPKEQAVQQFSDGVRVILSRIGILKSYDLTVLQALVLYMVC